MIRRLSLPLFLIVAFAPGPESLGAPAGSSILECEPGPELCNGLDDDCDVLVDEDFPIGEPCSAGLGACARFGAYVCAPDGQSAVCSAEPGPPSNEVCDEIDNDCDGTVDEGCGCSPPTGVPALQVSRPSPTGPSTLLSWNAVPEAAAYDVVRGGLTELRSTGGSFTAATQECLADDRTETSLGHDPGPSPGAGFWYLVRASGCGASASYDDASPARIGSRDAEIAASPAACP